MSLHAGQHLGRYRLDGVLARGGMGVVWRAWDSQDARPIAIKAVADRLIDVGDFQARFGDEVRRHSRLSHPNIVAILDVFRWDGCVCMAMDLIDGLSLETLLHRQPDHRLDAVTACRIVRGVLAPLDYAHRNGIVHRDVKPSNILLDAQGEPHLTDFGIAVAVGEARRTRAGVAVGTPHYMSPEQIRSSRDIDHRTDVYSVGCLLYEMLTGRPPFTVEAGNPAESDFLVKSAHLARLPVPPRALVATIPEWLDGVVLQALRKDRDERIAGCGRFSALIDAGERGSVVREPSRRMHRVALIAACTSIALVGVIAFVAWL